MKRMLAVGLMLSLGLPVAPARARDRIISARVEFTVRNVNGSGVPCVADGRSYTIRGLLEAPAAALRGPGRSVTLYLHSPVLSAHTLWRFDAVPGYNYSKRMAKAGHATITIDRLGYGRSDLPHGSATCYGSAADVASQVVEDLRRGRYRARGVRPVPIGRVALAGFSGGGLTAEIAAYSFRSVDALIVVGWADGGQDPGFAAAAAPDLPRCATGGEQKRAGGPSGYVSLFPDPDEFDRWLFANTDPGVLEAARQAHEADPCGELESIPQVLLVNNIRVGEIEIPVLLVFGDHDAVYPGSAAADQSARFAGSDDVTLSRIGGAGHTVMLERTHGIFERVMSEWLKDRGF